MAATEAESMPETVAYVSYAGEEPPRGAKVVPTPDPRIGVDSKFSSLQE